jgi:NAD-dependent DNA ligase
VVGKTTMTDKQLIPYYLMSCYLYYVKNENVLNDKEFDELCQRLYEKWDLISHPHKKLIIKENLKAQTGYSIKFPTIVKVCAMEWLKEQKNKIDIKDLFI